VLVKVRTNHKTSTLGIASSKVIEAKINEGLLVIVNFFIHSRIEYFSGGDYLYELKILAYPCYTSSS